MGVCASKPESCVGGKLRFTKRRRKTRRSRLITKSLSLNLNNKLVPIDDSTYSGFHPDLSSYVNPTFRVSTASLEEAWFDSHPMFEADWDDDFYSIQEDNMSTTCSVLTCQSSFSSPRCQSPAYGGCISRISSFKARHPRESSAEVAASKCSEDQKSCSSSSDSTTLSENSQDNNTQQQDDATSSGDFSFEDLDYSDQTPENDFKKEESGDNSKLIPRSNMFDVKTTSVLLVKVCRHRDDSAGLENYPVVANSCLPCLKMPNQHGVDRRRSVSPSPPGTRKKAAGSKVLPFRWRDDVSTPPLVSPRAPLQRPIAGSQIPYCPPEKKMSDCWSPIDPSTFSVRGHSFLRDKRKDLAPNHAAYYPFGVDVFRSHQKIDHIARFVELPPIHSSGKFPPILVVNIQIPLYPPSVFHREFDGEGMNVVLYFRLSENSNDLPRNFQENLRRLIDDEKEKVKSFPVETMAPFRERLKILSRLANLDELNLNSTEKKLLGAYNEKPVLSRPQHEFYSGDNYFEIDLDVHRFNYICRRGVDAIQDRLKHCVLDFGLTIQGSKPEDLPEHLLCCVRLNEIDFTNYRHLAI